MMPHDLAYQASPVKRRRATKAEMVERRAALFVITEEAQPVTVRGVYYQATVQNIVEKTDSGYSKVQTDLVWLRRKSLMRYDWLADNTRWQRKPVTYSGIEQALNDTARFYRKSLWDAADCYVEIWLEKDALAGVIQPVTSLYDVPLMVARGYASLSFLSSAAEQMARIGKPCFVYHFGDYDPSGVDAANKIHETLLELAPSADISFERMAITEEQIEQYELPTRPTKKSDSRSKGFGAISVELDAMPAPMLRALVEACINQHLPRDQLEQLQRIEAEERRALTMFASSYREQR